MNIFGIVGWSGSGKTELLIKLIPELKRRGFSVSTMKHTHHNFDMDQPGKDSYRHRESGAREVMVASSKRWVLQRELRDEPEFDMDELIGRMSDVDILLIEGFKRSHHDKLEVSRPSLGKQLLASDDPTVVAVASDQAIPGLAIPVLDLDDVSAVADHIISHLKAVPSSPSVLDDAAE
ncbi:MAG: molybdopterin-guanine dinucleotide biosynthesis protein B [Rhodospirillaceae bacterium]|nr:molybdopterin-guanine dinucleotide biosynthesis protein B [Rhodospirillaceae bacterium]